MLLSTLSFFVFLHGEFVTLQFITCPKDIGFGDSENARVGDNIKPVIAIAATERD